MDKRIIIIIGISAILLLIVGSLFFSSFHESSPTMKTANFDGITLNVPSNSNFAVDSNFYDDDHAIYITVYSHGVNQTFINETINSYINDNNLTEIHIDNLSSNIKTFISGNSNNTSIEVIITNNKGDKAIIIETPLEPQLAIKIGKSLKFPS